MLQLKPTILAALQLKPDYRIYSKLTRMLVWFPLFTKKMAFGTKKNGNQTHHCFVSPTVGPPPKKQLEKRGLHHPTSIAQRRLVIYILLIEEILHQMIGSLSHYLQGFIYARWLFWIASINSWGQEFVFLCQTTVNFSELIC